MKTLALSLIIHGEAVRFNRGKSRPDDFDFKFLVGPQGKKYPYVSSQCFKKFWRENLPAPFSSINRGQRASGAEKNQVYTDGDPILYLDDDLFGYMVAGADSSSTDQTDSEGASEDADSTGIDAEIDAYNIREDDIAEPDKLLEKLADESGKVSQQIRSHSDGNLNDLTGVIAALNQAILDPDFILVSGLKKLNRDEKASIRNGQRTIYFYNRLRLFEHFRQELVQPLTRDTTRRTSPIRMHALVAFSDIRMASDFQTFARDVELTGKNAVLNPNSVGIYSAWLQTRILIEASRVGKFYVGKNKDILPGQVQDLTLLSEPNPYSRDSGKSSTVAYVDIGEEKRRSRVSAAVRALADVGNKKGPASGALHDGSLRPKGFIGSVMNCADSPFDSIWRGTQGVPHLDPDRITAILNDWEDLFATKTIFVGLPVDYTEPMADVRSILESRLDSLGFNLVIDTPRRALLQLSEQWDI